MNSVAPVDSFDEWLGRLPSGWSLRKVGREFRLIGSGTTPPTENPAWYGDGYPWVTTGELRETLITETEKSVTEEAIHAFTTLRRYGPGTLLVAMYGATIGRVGILGCEATTNQACCALSEPTGLEPKYVYYWLQTFREQLIRKASGGGQPNVNQDTIRALRISSPTRPSQQYIVEFLDEHTARIDALIAEKEQLIEKLKEYWRSVSAEMVVRGIRKPSRVRNTHITWIGDIPDHWELRPLKTLFRLVAEPAADDHGLELLSLYTDIGVRPRRELEQRGNKASSTNGYWLVKKDDLVVNKLLAWMGAIAASAYSGVTSPAYDILRPTISLNTWYFDALFRSGIYLTEFKSKSRGIMDMRLRLYFDELGTVKVPFPPKEEQDEIVKALDEKKAHVDELVGHCTVHISRLREYRSSLISAAVTGQIDVGTYKRDAVNA